MATTLIQSETISFDQNIFTVINDLKKKRKRADIDSIHKEIIKTIDFKDTTKDDLQDRINILLINEKLINKINRNLNSYSVNEANTNTEYGTNQVLSSNSYFANSNNDINIDIMTQHEKIKVESFKENILQNLRNNIKEILDSEFTIFKSKCEELVQTSSVRYNKQIDHLQNELKTKDK